RRRVAELGSAARRDARALVRRRPGVPRRPGPAVAGPPARAGPVPGRVHRCADGVRDPGADPGGLLPARGPLRGGLSLAPSAVPPDSDERDPARDRAAPAAVACRGAPGTARRGCAGGTRRALVDLARPPR